MMLFLGGAVFLMQQRGVFATRDDEDASALDWGTEDLQQKNFATRQSNDAVDNVTRLDVDSVTLEFGPQLTDTPGAKRDLSLEIGPNGLCKGSGFEEMCTVLDLTGDTRLLQRISEFVDTRPRNIVEFLGNIGLNPEAQTSGVTCVQLCEAVVSVIPPEERPPQHDIACSRDVSRKQGAVCDVDVSPAKLQLELPADEFIHHVAFNEEGIEAVEVVFNTSQMEEDDVQAHLKDTGLQPARRWEEVVLLVARMFRIYPRAWWIRDGEEQQEIGSALLEEGTAVDLQRGEILLATAKAWMARTNQLMKLGRVHQKHYLTWFGHADESFVKKLYGRLLAIGEILDESIVKRGSGCGGGTIAYVTPSLFFQKSWKSGFNSYSLYLCPTWEKVHLAEQIGTMVHEASHHKPVQTDDVCADHVSGRKGIFCDAVAYGRKLCKKLAKHDHSSGTFVSYNNADNWEFFLEDVNKRK